MKIWGITILGVSILLFFCVYLRTFVGINNFYKSKKIIDSFPNEKQYEMAINNFYGDFYGFDPNNTYGGILLLKSRLGFIVLGNKGFKFFYPRQGVIYRNIDGCEFEQVTTNKVSNKITLYTTEYIDWFKNVDVGDNVVILSKSNIQLFFNRSDFMVYGFDWWYFLMDKPHNLCTD